MKLKDMFSPHPLNPKQYKALSPVETAVKQAIFQCGLRGEEAAIAEYYTLLKLGVIEKAACDKKSE